MNQCQTKLAQLYVQYLTVDSNHAEIQLCMLQTLSGTNELEMLIHDELGLYVSYIDTDFKESEYMEDLAMPKSIELGDPIRIYHTDMHSVWIFADGTWFEDGAMLMF